MFGRNHPKPEKKEVLTLNETFIFIDGIPYRRHDLEKEELDIIKSLVRILDRLTSGTNKKVRLVLQTNFSENNSIFLIMAIQLNVGQFSLDTLSLIDSDTGNAVAATFANNSFTSSDSNVFTSTVDGTDPNSTRDQAVNAGSATLNVSSDVTYTDANTNQSVTKTLTLAVPVTVVAVVAGENVALVMTQGTPQTV